MPQPPKVALSDVPAKGRARCLAAVNQCRACAFIRIGNQNPGVWVMKKWGVLLLMAGTLLFAACHHPARWVVLIETTGGSYIDCVGCVSTSLSRLTLGDIDVVLLDLASTGGGGVRRFGSLQSQSPDIPTIVFADRDSEKLAMNAMGDGAKSYLLTESVNRQELACRLENVAQYEGKIC